MTEYNLPTLEEIAKDKRDLLKQAIRDLGRNRIRGIISETEKEGVKIERGKVTNNCNYVVSTSSFIRNERVSYSNSVFDSNAKIDSKDWLIYSGRFRNARNAVIANKILLEYLNKIGG